MLNPNDLQTAIVNQLQAIPELVNFIGDIGQIQAYDDESMTDGSPELAELSLMGRALMVFWQGAGLPRSGEVRGWKHIFKIGLKCESIMAYYEAAQLIFDGIPAAPVGDGFNSFLNCEILPELDGIQDATIEPELSKDGVGRIFITFSLFERN